MTQYDPRVEKLNIISHAIGLILSLAALPFLIIKATNGEETLYIASAASYGVSLIILYAASTVYHAADRDDLRETLETLDHASIFVLISGSYTPFALVVLTGNTGWILFGAAWIFAIIGIGFKFITNGQYKKVSLVLFVLMGLMSLIFAEPLVDNLRYGALIWLGIGGFFYLIGAALYGLKPLEFNHAVFHTLILLGSISHFLAIYFYVLA